MHIIVLSKLMLCVGVQGVSNERLLLLCKIYVHTRKCSNLGATIIFDSTFDSQIDSYYFSLLSKSGK